MNQIESTRTHILFFQDVVHEVLEKHERVLNIAAQFPPTLERPAGELELYAWREMWCEPMRQRIVP